MSDATTPPAAQRGQLYVNPETGEKRIKFGDLPKAKQTVSADKMRMTVSLADILTGVAGKLPGATPDTVLVIKPVNLYGIKLLEQAFGGLENIPDPERMTMAQQLAVVTCLCNQDLPEHHPMTEAEVGQYLNGENLELIAAVLQEAIRPLAVEAQRRAETLAKNLNASAGLGSPTSPSPNSVSETPTNSADSPSAG